MAVTRSTASQRAVRYRLPDSNGSRAPEGYLLVAASLLVAVGFVLAYLARTAPSRPPRRPARAAISPPRRPVRASLLLPLLPRSPRLELCRFSRRPSASPPAPRPVRDRRDPDDQPARPAARPPAVLPFRARHRR